MPSSVVIGVVPVQAAFKRPVAGSGIEASALDSTMDWDAVKPEDRTLIEQVHSHAVCTFHLTLHWLSPCSLFFSAMGYLLLALLLT